MIAYQPVYSETLTKRIMRRVYFIWFMKRIAPTLALQVTSLALTLVGIHEFISVKFVLANAADSISGINSLIGFTRSAVANTGFIPQLLLGASTLLGLLIVRDVMRALHNRTGGVLRPKAGLLAERVITK